MIFSKDDVTVLGRIIMRKGCETARYTFDPDIDDFERYHWVDEITRQIGLARFMSSLGRDELCNIRNQLRIVEDGIAFMPEWMGKRYFAELSERDRADEVRFSFMAGKLIRTLPLLKVSVGLASEGLGGDLSLNGEDATILRGVRATMERLSDLSVDDPDRMDGTERFINNTLEICSAVTRIRSGKSIESSEISRILLKQNISDECDFDCTLLDEMTPLERENYDRYAVGTGRYITAMYAKCILNSQYPETRTLRYFPHRGSWQIHPSIPSNSRPFEIPSIG